MADRQPFSFSDPALRRCLPFAFLYLGEGAPIGFVWWALPTWLRARDVPVEEITSLTSLLVLPWVLKFFWAPLVDHAQHLRRWIAAAQVLMVGTLAPLLWLDPVQHFGLFRGCLLLHAFSAATQDVAVDALALRLVPEVERGRLNSFMQIGMLVGRSVFGGGALVLASSYGWTAVISGLMGCVMVSLVALAFLPPTAADGDRSERRFNRDAWKRVLPRRGLWVGLGFALMSASAFELAGGLAGPAMLDGGISQEFVGVLLGVPVVGATIVGSGLGGYLADRFGHRRVVMGGLVWFCAATLAWAGVIHLRVLTPAVCLVVLGGLYLGVGVFTAASYALFMDLSRPPLAATQFSAFMAATNGCEAWVMLTGGWLIARAGYPAGLAAAVLVSCVALLWLVPLKKGLGSEVRTRLDGDES